MQLFGFLQELESFLVPPKGIEPLIHRLKVYCHSTWLRRQVGDSFQSRTGLNGVADHRLNRSPNESIIWYFHKDLHLESID